LSPAAFASGAHELFVALVNLSLSTEQVAGLPWAERVHRERPDLVRRVRGLWTDGNTIARPGAEVFALAALGGYLEDLTPDRLLVDLPDAVSEVLAAPRPGRHFPWFPDLLELVGARLKALHDDPARLDDYQDLLFQVWAEISTEWRARGLATAQAEAALFSQKLAGGGALLDLVPQRHLIRLDWCRPVLEHFLAQDRVAVLPSYFAQGHHAYDLGGWFFVGYCLQTHSLAQHEADRSALVARRMKAFSDPTRLTMLAYLSQLPVTVSDLAAILHVAQPTVSEHLRLLKDAGLVTAMRDKNRLYYRTDGEAVQALLKLVGELTVR
jgi:ArsR family transcriptional regulator, arsenate/arsenite/antimonite-responsive transcriptional repressor